MGETRPWPRVMVVTDRHRLVHRIGVPADRWPEVLQAQVAAAIAGGADLIQIREPDLPAARLASFLRDLFARIPGSAPRVVVNDRLDVAWVTGAAGVHLTERSLGVGDASAVLPASRPWLIGRSVHAGTAVADVRMASYLVAGTVLPSESKPPGSGVLGWTGLAELARAAGQTPVLAIGGLAADKVGDVIRAGATGVAGIGCFLPESGEDVVRGVQQRVRDMIRAFDSAGG